MRFPWWIPLIIGVGIGALLSVPDKPLCVEIPILTEEGACP